MSVIQPVGTFLLSYKRFVSIAKDLACGPHPKSELRKRSKIQSRGVGVWNSMLFVSTGHAYSIWGFHIYFSIIRAGWGF